MRNTNLTELINTTLIEVPVRTIFINMTTIATLQENITGVQVCVRVSVCASSSTHRTNNVNSSWLILSSPPQSEVEHLEGTLLVLEVAVGTRDEIPDNTTLVSHPTPHHQPSPY